MVVGGIIYSPHPSIGAVNFECVSPALGGHYYKMQYASQFSADG